MAMLAGSFRLSPELFVAMSIPGRNETTMTLRLPIYINRFIERVEMPEEVFARHWSNITLNQPDTFQKVDLVLKNPAPSNVPVQSVLDKLSNFFSNCLNLKVHSAGTTVEAVGQLVCKPSSREAFPENPADTQQAENVPLMLQAQFYPDVDPSLFRLSLRAANNKRLASEVINFIRFYMKV